MMNEVRLEISDVFAFKVRSQDAVTDGLLYLMDAPVSTTVELVAVRDNRAAIMAQIDVDQLVFGRAFVGVAGDEFGTKSLIPISSFTSLRRASSMCSPKST